MARAGRWLEGLQFTVRTPFGTFDSSTSPLFTGWQTATGRSMQVPLGMEDAVLDAGVPGGSSFVGRGHLSPVTRGYYAEGQDAALREALDPTNSLWNRAVAGGGAVLRQPVVALESLIGKPAGAGLASLGDSGTHGKATWAALRRLDFEEAAFSALETGNDIVQAFNGLSAPVVVGYGAFTGGAQAASRIPLTNPAGRLLQSEVYLAPAPMMVDPLGLQATVGRMRLRMPEPPVSGGPNFIGPVRAEDLVTWVDEGGNLRAGGSPGMRPDAYLHQSSAPGARSNFVTGYGQAPYLSFSDESGSVIGAKFDGAAGLELIDRKLSPYFSEKAVDQATRQAAVARHYGLRAVWELPTQDALEAANRFLKSNNLNGINVRRGP
jgi:hypothetical protein